MNGQIDPNAPELAKRDRMGYYYWLISQGMPHRQAYDAAVGAFGAPKSPEEQAKDAAKAKQLGGLAQTGGMVGGVYAANKLGGLFGASSAPTSATLTNTGTLAAPKIVSVKALGAGGAQAGAAPGASTLSSIGSIALPVAAGAAIINNAWETGMKDIVRGKGDRADWTNQLANMTGVGAVANMGLRLLGKRSIGAMMKSGKSLPERIRDDFRGDLKSSGVADDKYMVTLADGSKYNIGLGGKTKLQNVGENIDGKATRNTWDVDWSNPLSKFATDKIEPMIRNIYGADDPKRKYYPGHFTGMLVNAVMSNAKSEQDILANIETVLGKSKFAQEAGVGIQPPPPPKPPKGQVVRVSPGMYMNDKGQIKPATSIKQALKVNYDQTKKKDKKKDEEL